MKYTVVNTVAVILALIIMIIVSTIKNEDVKNKRKYQEVIMFVYIFGVFIILMSGVEWLYGAKKTGVVLPMLITSMIMTGIVITIYIATFKN